MHSFGNNSTSKMLKPKQKQKQTRLNLAEKINVLKKLNSGVRANRLAIEFNVSEAAICKIKKNRDQIMQIVSNTHHELKKKTLHKPEYEDLENKLYEWFLKQRDRNCPMNGPVIRAKAKDLFVKLYPEKNANDFCASDGWFQKFKRRFGIRFLKICGEILSSDTSDITSFIHRFRAKVTEMQLTNEQLYNADESGLFFRLLPDKTYVAACEKTAPGRKIRKERISFLLCSNAEGTNKVKPLVIGKSKKPRCFAGFNNPLDYANSKKAWMTSNIFQHWFKNTFVKEVSVSCVFILSFIYIFRECIVSLFMPLTGASI